MGKRIARSVLRSNACLSLSTMSRPYERCETMIKRVWCSTVALEPSKLSVRVRISSPAPDSVCSSVRLEHRPMMAEVGGSNPFTIRFSGASTVFDVKRGWRDHLPPFASDSDYGERTEFDSPVVHSYGRRVTGLHTYRTNGSPVAPTVFDAKRGCSSIGRASACHAEGRRFEPDHPLQIPTYCRRCGCKSRQRLQLCGCGVIANTDAI